MTRPICRAELTIRPARWGENAPLVSYHTCGEEILDVEKPDRPALIVDDGHLIHASFAKHTCRIGDQRVGSNRSRIAAHPFPDRNSEVGLSPFHQPA